MTWQVTTPPDRAAIDPNNVLFYHLNLDPDVAQEDQFSGYMNELLDGAIEYAETAMQMSLAPRTITATYFTGDELDLPRGPVIAVTSVTDANGNAVTGYTVQTTGTNDSLNLNTGFVGPLTVVYTAGYPNGVPPDIRQAIRVHVGSMYENRESVTDRPSNVVPHSMDAFYALKRREVGTG